MDLKAALEACDAAEAAGELSYQKIADKYSLSRSTLSRRHRGVCASRKDGYSSRQKLTPQQEYELCSYIADLTERGLAPTRQMVVNFASEMAKQYVGDGWVTRFLHRHPEQFIYKWTSPMDASRHDADRANKYAQYFDLLRDKIEQYSILPQHTYNMDEKGLAIGLVNRSKRIFGKAAWEAGGKRQSLQDGNREWVSILATICADGSVLSPGVIFTGAPNTLQQSWVEDLDAGKDSIFTTATPSGWYNDEVGLAWLEQVFDRETAAKARTFWRLLIVDYH